MRARCLRRPLNFFCTSYEHEKLEQNLSLDEIGFELSYYSIPISTVCIPVTEAEGFTFYLTCKFKVRHIHIEGEGTLPTSQSHVLIPPECPRCLWSSPKLTRQWWLGSHSDPHSQ